MVDWYLQLTDTALTKLMLFTIISKGQVIYQRWQGGLVQMWWGSYLFLHLKMGACIKLSYHFWGAMYFCAFQFLFQKNRNNTEGINYKSVAILLFYHQNDGSDHSDNDQIWEEGYSLFALNSLASFISVVLNCFCS